MPANAGRLLLFLASSDSHSVTQLTAASGLSPTETLGQLGYLVEHGFIVAGTPGGDVALYRLNPKGVRTEAAEPHQRILLIEDELEVQELMTTVLEEAGYALILARAPADAETLLQAIAFDLVITDSFSQTSGAPLTGTTAIVAAAGGTPVALFTGHRVELEGAVAAGFRDLLAKPFDLDMLERQVRALLR